MQGNLLRLVSIVSWFLLLGLAAPLCRGELPGDYFPKLNKGLSRVERVMAAMPEARLSELERQPGMRHFPSAVLVAAVLYAKEHPANRRYHDRRTLTTALAIGDLIAREIALGAYGRLDNHRDTYMWLDAYRLLEGELGEPRRKRWREALMGLVAPLAADVDERKDYPWYNSPYIVTSPNHYSLWSSTVHLAGKVFGNQEWQDLGARVMHRFAAEEQTEDGYWGEHSRDGPTTGYDYLTSTAVALYYEHSGDPAALEALRRSTDFHKYFTYPDGTPVDTVNDRNRYWGVPMWGGFGFSHFPDGRRYAEFLLDRYGDDFGIEDLGRMAQSALYFHEGETAPIPTDLPRFFHRLQVPAGMRKEGPWVVSLSGIVSTPAASQFYLDRQTVMGVFHEKLGLIISGANSKHQPELATVSETVKGKVYHMPMSSRLTMTEQGDRLALGYNKFFSELTFPELSENRLRFRFRIRWKGGAAPARLTLQLVLKPGEILETGGGKRVKLSTEPGSEPLRLTPQDIGGWIRHGGWTLKTESPVELEWPVYPYNPYSARPETGLAHAVGAYRLELEPRSQVVDFTLETR